MVRKTGFWLIAAGTALVVLLTIALRRPGHSFHLKNGSVLSLEEVKFGATNTFFTGSKLERMFRRVIPKGGIHLGPLNLQLPSMQRFADPNGDTLAMLFRVSGTNPPMQSFGNPQIKMVITSDGGHEYETYLFPSSIRAASLGTEQFWFARISAFPRDERMLRLKFVQTGFRTDDALGQFVLSNPTHAEKLAWKPEQTPIVRRFGQLEMTVGDIAPNPRFLPFGWQKGPAIALRVLNRGVLETNWLLQDNFLRDNLGNFSYAPASKVDGHDWQYEVLHARLDPKNVWEIKAHLARNSGFSADQLFTFEVPIPLAGSISTNHLGVPVTISFVNTDMLAVEIPTNRTDLRLTFVSAHDPSGREIHENTGNRGQHHFWRQVRLSSDQLSGGVAFWQPPKPVGRITATVAIHPDYAFECIVQPGTNALTQRRKGAEAQRKDRATAIEAQPDP